MEDRWEDVGTTSISSRKHAWGEEGDEAPTHATGDVLPPLVESRPSRATTTTTTTMMTMTTPHMPRRRRRIRDRLTVDEPNHHNHSHKEEEEEDVEEEDNNDDNDNNDNNDNKDEEEHESPLLPVSRQRSHELLDVRDADADGVRARHRGRDRRGESGALGGPKEEEGVEMKVVSLEADDEKLCVVIHRTDPLRPHLRLLNPLVRFRFVDLVSGRTVHAREPWKTAGFSFRGKGTLTPHWEEEFVVDHASCIVREDILMFLEVLDFGEGRDGTTSDTSVCFPVAWAFLRPVGIRGSLHVGTTVRLQLYQYPKTVQWFSTSSARLPSVFKLWKKRTERYTSALYVTLRRIHDATPSDATLAVNAMTDSSVSKRERTTTFDEPETEETYRLRMPGQRCWIPSTPFRHLAPTARGCFALAFSNRGAFLAAGCGEHNAFTLRLYHVDSGLCSAILTGHQDLIYDLAWSSDDKEVISASSDGTARVWSLQSWKPGDAAMTGPGHSQGLFHPCFVYCARLHPRSTMQLAATGGFDRKVRLWDLTAGKVSATLEGHEHHVNSITFDSRGGRLYSADNGGTVRVWRVEEFEDQTVGCECVRVFAPKELVGDPISCIRLHPVNRCLLVENRRHTMCQLDLQSGCVNLMYVGLACSEHPLRCQYSPDGQYVLGGSEDRRVYVWNTSTGGHEYVYEDLGLADPVHTVDWHPTQHIVALGAFGSRNPVLLFSNACTSDPKGKKPSDTATGNWPPNTSSAMALEKDVKAKMAIVDTWIHSMAPRPPSAPRGGREPIMQPVEPEPDTFNTALEALQQSMNVLRPLHMKRRDESKPAHREDQVVTPPPPPRSRPPPAAASLSEDPGASRLERVRRRLDTIRARISAVDNEEE